MSVCARIRMCNLVSDMFLGFSVLTRPQRCEKTEDNKMSQWQMKRVGSRAKGKYLATTGTKVPRKLKIDPHE